MRFNHQLESDISAVKGKVEKPALADNEPLIIPFLKKNSTKRALNAVASFLESEIRFSTIPYESSSEVTVSFFVKQYRQKELRRIRKFGETSFISLVEVLGNNGYHLLP